LDDGVEPISKKMSMVMEFPNIPILKYRWGFEVPSILLESRLKNVLKLSTVFMENQFQKIPKNPDFAVHQTVTIKNGQEQNPLIKLNWHIFNVKFAALLITFCNKKGSLTQFDYSIFTWRIFYNEKESVLDRLLRKN
jgi:hypothetical protein